MGSYLLFLSGGGKIVCRQMWCVCVCVRERERDTHTHTENYRGSTRNTEEEEMQTSAEKNSSHKETPITIPGERLSPLTAPSTERMREQSRPSPLVLDQDETNHGIVRRGGGTAKGINQVNHDRSRPRPEPYRWWFAWHLTRSWSIGISSSSGPSPRRQQQSH